MRYAIDPQNITNFNRTVGELQTFWLFCVLVAGKNSRVQAAKLEDFLKPASDFNLTPFYYIYSRYFSGHLDSDIRAVKFGQYDRIYRCFVESHDLDLKTCSIYDLENIFGVGPKTARFFLLHSRQDQNFAVLDTHVLKWIRDELGYDVPKATPTNPNKYHELETIYLDYCHQNRLFPAELDLQIWKKYNNKRFGEE
jgi:hypothetical protein